MPYCITLRSRTDASIEGWYAGRNCRWSTDHKRQKRFDNQRDASAVCQELRSLYARNANVINIEFTQDDAEVRPDLAPRPSGLIPISRGGVKRVGLS
jgi:hypothetical protein